MKAGTAVILPNGTPTYMVFGYPFLLVIAGGAKLRGTIVSFSVFMAWPVNLKGVFFLAHL